MSKPKLEHTSSRTPRGRATDPPAALALVRLLQAELAQARAYAPALVEQCDPGRVWLLWFSIGATDEICRMTLKHAEEERNQLFRHVVATIFDDGVKAQANPSKARPELVKLFEAAGVEAVQACMRGEDELGHYLAALEAGWSLMD